MSNSQSAAQPTFRTGPLSPEVLVPRLGDSLVEKGLLKPEELKRALTYQKQLGAQGKRVLLGQALVDLGLIDRANLDKAITEQIAHLQEALRQSNLFLEQRVRERTAELQDALDKLKELDRLKNDFISNVSHELRTPLAHMTGYIELLSQQALGPLSKKQRSAISVLEKSHKRLGSLIDDLLFLSFNAVGSLHLEPEPVQLRELFSKVVEQNQAIATSEEVSLSQEVPINLPPVRADRNKLEWALNKLMENGIKFNRPGGRVRFSARLDRNHVQVTVADTGIGIAADKLGEIFEPFHQLDSSTTRRQGGAGIGLSLAKLIIEAHGSILKVDSQQAKGTLFSFSLPMYKVKR